MTTTKTTKKPTKQPTRVKRVRHNLQEQQRWELFAAAALCNLAGTRATEDSPLPPNQTLDPVECATIVAAHADAMVEEWRKRWGRK